MVVAGPEGFQRHAYRRFYIRDPEAAGDDYAMLRETFTRRFHRSSDAGRDSGPDSAQRPDLVLIDGGLGQLNAVNETSRCRASNA